MAETHVLASMHLIYCELDPSQISQTPRLCSFDSVWLLGVCVCVCVSMCVWLVDTSMDYWPNREQHMGCNNKIQHVATTISHHASPVERIYRWLISKILPFPHTPITSPPSSQLPKLSQNQWQGLTFCSHLTHHRLSLLAIDFLYLLLCLYCLECLHFLCLYVLLLCECACVY